MTSKQILQGVGIFTGITGFILVGALVSSPRLQAANDDHRDGDDALVELGLRIAPVHLTYPHRDREKVGLGSYIVNAVADCNGCHTLSPQDEYAPGGNPYLLPGPNPPNFNGTTTVNKKTYLGGGQDFGPIDGITDIVSRNLTPDTSGLPEGGASFTEFVNSVRHGIDADSLHPNMAFPFDGSKLQVMPWPTFQHMTDEHLEAIYAYLKAVPCVAGTPTPGTAPTFTPGRDLTTHLCP